MNRRRVLLGGRLAALAMGLTDCLQYRRAIAANTGPEPDDGRPAMKGTASMLFIGHGSPMKALQDNTFTRHLRVWGRQLGAPKAIQADEQLQHVFEGFQSGTISMRCVRWG